MPVTFTKIVFDSPVNPSLQVGDMVYVSSVSNGIIGTPTITAKVVTIASHHILIDQDNTSGTIINNGDYILFAKNIQVNESSLKGYYADVTFENSSNKKAELFAVSSEVVLSSK
jgi:hypothetical protein